MFEIPVAIFLFNRPECTRQLYSAIATLKPIRLFIVADGPRKEHEADQELCATTRAVFNTIDWPCEVTKIYSEHNLGCRNSIPNGLSLIFKEVEECIILEDDCIPQQSFFMYCKELLARYKDDDKIMSIGGHRSDGPSEFNTDSYFFSKYPNIWGWATWKHKWEKYDLKMVEWSILRNTSWLNEILNDDAAVAFWKRMFDKMHNGMDTWDYALVFSSWLHNSLSIRPKVSMISNIGFDNNATHTKTPINGTSFPEAADMTFPLHHPSEINIDEESEKRIEWVSFSGMDKRILENVRSSILRRRQPTTNKVLHLSTYDEHGGAARAAKRIFQALTSQSFDFEMLTLHKTSDDNSIKLPKQLDTTTRLKLIHQLLTSYRKQKDNPQLVLQSYGEASAGIVDEINTDESGLVHLHWICNFLSIEDIAKINKPIVWTLHDMWPFAGSEHYSFDQEAYFYKEPTTEDTKENSRLIWKKKYELWKNKDINVVAPSRWLGRCAEKSAIFRNANIRVIPYPIDINFWIPENRKEAKAFFGLDTKKFQILFSAKNALKDHTKGWDLLQETLIKLHQDSKIDFELIVIGQEGEIDINVPFTVRMLGNINDDKTLVNLYSAVDVLVVPSRAEAFSQVTLEAQSCGLPVVGFDIGGLPDIVMHQQTGWISSSYDTIDLAKGIQWIMENEDRCTDLSVNARKNALEKFSPEVVAKEYMELYKEILAK